MGAELFPSLICSKLWGWGYKSRNWGTKVLTKITLEVTIVRVCDRTDTCLLGLNPKTMLSLFHVYINQYVKKVSVCFCVCMREREIDREINFIFQIKGSKSRFPSFPRGWHWGQHNCSFSQAIWWTEQSNIKYIFMLRESALSPLCQCTIFIRTFSSAFLYNCILE